VHAAEAVSSPLSRIRFRFFLLNGKKERVCALSLSLSENERVSVCRRVSACSSNEHKERKKELNRTQEGMGGRHAATTQGF